MGKVDSVGLIDQDKDYSLTVGFQGVKGSFSEEALIQHFGYGVDMVNVEEFEDIFIELKNNNIDYGVLPIENSSTGGISEVYDLLNKYEFYIVGEEYVKVNHHLMAIDGSSIEDIKEVYSHSQAFSQCSEFLNGHTNWKLIPYHNTAKSAEHVKKSNKKYMAAIGSIRASKLYGLKILKYNINTNNYNSTRFVIISKHMRQDKDCNKISAVLSLEHRAGSLYNALRAFAKNDINLLKIESRPIKDRPWQYIFYIDFEGNLSNENAHTAVELVKESCLNFRLIGSYTKSEVEKIE